MTDTTPRGAARRPAACARRALPLALLAALAFGVGIVVASGGDDGGDAVRAYAKAWSAGDWATMRAQLTSASQEQIGLLPFAEAERSALATATASERAVTTGEAREASATTAGACPVAVRTPDLRHRQGRDRRSRSRRTATSSGSTGSRASSSPDCATASA